MVVASLAAWFGLWRSPWAIDPPGWTTAVVTVGDLAVDVPAAGRLEAEGEVEVAGRLAGDLAEICVEEGAAVRAGDVLARLGPAPYRAALRQAETDLRAAVATRDTALFWLAQARRGRAAEAACLALHEAEALVAQRRAGRDRASANVESCAIRAPFEGVVVARHAQVGQRLGAVDAPALFTLSRSLDRLRLQVRVPEGDVRSVRSGQPVAVSVRAGEPGRVFPGCVRSVRPFSVGDMDAVQYLAVIDVDNAAGTLRPGMAAGARLRVADRADAILVPTAALRLCLPPGSFVPPDDTSRAAVAATLCRAPVVLHADIFTGEPTGGTPGIAYLVASGNEDIPPASTKDPRPRAVRVRTGLSDGHFTEVLAGLEPGDVVITDRPLLSAPSPVVAPTHVQSLPANEPPVPASPAPLTETIFTFAANSPISPHLHAAANPRP